jgi:hypothetical protein
LIENQEKKVEIQKIWAMGSASLSWDWARQDMRLEKIPYGEIFWRKTVRAWGNINKVLILVQWATFPIPIYETPAPVLY